jgi:NAD(P)H-dependent FMN reductase
MTKLNVPKIGIILSTTRQARFADRATQWLGDIVKTRDDMSFEVVDLRDFDLPMFDAVGSPRFVPLTDPEQLRFVHKIAEFDGYIFMTAEYNHTVPAVLSNALTYIFDELAKKPAAFVAYGAVGGARAVEHLRGQLIELSMVPTKSAVHIGWEPMKGMLFDGKGFEDFPYLVPTATPMLDELAWYARVLKVGRETQADAAVAA